MRDDAELDVAVIGAGVIGLAIARALARSGREVVVIEAEKAVGTHTSSRNSEVIHAGILYPEGSEKAALCVAGKALLYAYAASNGVPHARLGKLIVATREEELPALDRIVARAQANGVHDLEWLERARIAELEPAVTGVRGLFSPSTGIVDSHALMAALRRDAVERGAALVLGTPVLAGQIGPRHIELELGGSAPSRVRCNAVVNAAGLGAEAVSRSLRGLDRASVPETFFAKGQYFLLRGPAPFRHLVYPVPGPDGLGVHVTLDLAGRVRFGPDVSWVDGIDYAFDDSRATAFYAAVRRYYRALPDGALEPGYTGIRPKLGLAGSVHDFVLRGPDDHGRSPIVALYGIESPGLTASLAIAERVATMLSA